MAHTNALVKAIAYKLGVIIPDKFYLRLRYRLTFHKKLNLKNPVTYNEKLQWMKLYDRNPIYSRLVDKYEVKKYINEVIGNEYVIPTIGIWNRFEEIDFDMLPDEFVLKCTHDSGSVIICENKLEFDIEKARNHFNKKLKKSEYLGGREWAYKNVKPRIIAEPYFRDETGGPLKDYKFFCFDGQVKSLFIATDRGTEGTDVKFDFFDENYNHLNLKHGHENAEYIPQKPVCFDEMKRIASMLSKGLRHARIDLYYINHRIYFGEITFYHHCGFVKFEPEEWDEAFGNWLKI